MSYNDIDEASTKGAEAIGNGLQYLSNLRVLDLSNSYRGYIGDLGIETIGKRLRYLSHLTYLDLSGNNMGDTGTKGAEAIGKGLQYLANLTYLDLNYNSIGLTGTSGIEAIGKSLPFLPHLTYLDLSNNWIGHKGTAGLGAIAKGLQSLSHLTYLDLSGNDIGSTGDNSMDILVDNILRMPFLETLYIRQWDPTFPLIQLNRLRRFWNHRGPTDIYFLREIKDVQNYLTGLPLDTTMITLRDMLDDPSAELMEDTMQYLARFSNLTYLDLSYNDIDELNTAAEAVGDNLQYFPNLTSLDLSRNSIGVKGTSGTEAIGKGLQFLSYLTYLDLSNNNIGSKEIEPIGHALQYLPNLTYLDLSRNSIGVKGTSGTEAIGKGLQYLPNLTHLDLSGNWIGDTGTTGIEAIGKGLRYLSNLRVLDLGGNYMGSKGIEAIGQALQYLPNLISLDLGYEETNPTDVSATIALAEGLKHIPNLTSLDLSHNWIGWADSQCEGTIALAEGIGSLHHLQTLYLIQNTFGIHGPEGVKALFENIPFGQLCAFNIGEVYNLAWTEGQRAVYELNRKPIEESCYAQRCFGRTEQPVLPSPCGNTTGPTGAEGASPSLTVPGQTLLQYEMLDLLSETESSSQEFIIEEEQEHQPAWHQRLRHGVHTLWQGTKDRVTGMTDWVLEKVIGYVDQVTHENESYFPNIDDPTQRYWGETSGYNTTSMTNSTVPSVGVASTGALPPN